MTQTQQAAHLSLYRKYRPATFKDVVGQDHIVSVLEESIRQGKISHAYLFAGSRGIGKTSIARIFARALGTTANDLYEIDAASNTSVDDIRELSEAVNTVPFESKYKVYILDEVHMLSKAAFNAFLKTLEEPPRHVIFILATTETEKLPDTIVSRCEVYTFKKPTVEILKKRVLDVVKLEAKESGSGTTLEPAAAELIALLGDGSFRDTLSTLQKVLNLKEGGTITLADVEKITGAPKSGLVLDYAKGLLAKDASQAIAALNQAAADNLDMKVFAKLVMTRLRYVLMRLVSEREAEQLVSDISTEDVAALNALAKDQKADHVADTLRKMLDSYQLIGKTHIASLPLELLAAETAATAKKA